MTQHPATASAAHLPLSDTRAPAGAGADVDATNITAVTDLADARRKTGYDTRCSTGCDVENLATRTARTRQLNAHRATYAAAALHRHGQASHSDADSMPQALVELLTDLHHLCDSCDLDLAPLYQAAALIHAHETHAA